MKVEYVWWEQRKNFIEKSLNAGACDAIMGVPATLDSVAVTQPYYRSTYVWVSARGSQPGLSSLFDERLAELRIGVHIVDDSYAPPAQFSRTTGWRRIWSASVFLATAPNPIRARLIEAVTRGEVDVGSGLGSAGRLLRGSRPRDHSGIAAAVRHGAVSSTTSRWAFGSGMKMLRDEAECAPSSRQCAAIEALLREYKVPQRTEGGRRALRRSLRRHLPHLR